MWWSKILKKSVAFILPTVAGASLLFAPAVYASGWTESNLTGGTPYSNKAWTPIAISGSGKYIASLNTNDGYVYYSSDYGKTFTQSSDGNTSYTTSMSMSYSGKYVVTVSTHGNVYISSNYGVNWKDVAAGTSLSGLNWQQVVSSYTGKYMVATASTDGLYLSSDYGATWKNVVPGTAISGLGFNNATISSDGQRLTVDDGSDIYGSSNGGASWTKLTTGALDGQAWYGLSASSDGRRITAAVYGGDVYMSDDYGATWTNLTTGTGVSGLSWVYLQSSPTGQFLVGAIDNTVGGGAVYASRDYGATWTNLTSGVTPSGQTWDYQVISASGQYVFASTDGVNGNMYEWNDPSLQPVKPALTNHTVTVSVNGSATYNVLTGASGYDADTLTIVSGPSHGVAVDPAGDITYTPNKGYSGSDSLVYRVCAPLDDTVCSQATLLFAVAANAPDTGYGSPGSTLPTKLLVVACGLIVTGGALSKKSSRPSH